jgi:hypothetical protein
MRIQVRLRRRLLRTDHSIRRRPRRRLLRTGTSKDVGDADAI